MRVKDILIPKLLTIDSNATMQEARTQMLQNGFRHLPVSNGVNIIGIISDRDIKLATVMRPNGSKTDEYILSYKRVSDYMSSPVLKASTQDRIENLVRDMVNFKVSCFVIENESGEDIGIITTEDLLIAFLDLLVKPSFFQRLGKFWENPKSLK